MVKLFDSQSSKFFDKYATIPCTFIVLCIIFRIDNESTNESMSKKTNNERDTMNATRKIDNFVKPEYRSKDLLEKDNVTRALGKIVSYVNLFDDEYEIADYLSICSCDVTE